MYRIARPMLLVFAVVALASMTGLADAQTTLYGDIDGLPGNEKIVSFGSTITVTYPTTGRVQTFAVNNPYNYFQLVHLNAAPGNEILLTYSLSINGLPNTSPMATVINPVQNTNIAYNVGSWSSLLLAEVNGQTGTDLVFHNGGIAFGGSNVTVVMRENGVIQAFPYSMPAASFNNVTIVDLNAAPGDEILLTNTLGVAGGSVLNPTAIVITPAQNTLRSFFVGPWTSFQIAELNGQPGSEVVFDDRDGFFGGTSLGVLMRNEGSLTAYPYRSLTYFNNLQLLDDGQGGANIFLSANVTLFGLPDNGTVVTVITPRTNALRAYAVGYWVSYAFKYINGVAGLNVVFNTGYGTAKTLYPGLGILK